MPPYPRATGPPVPLTQLLPVYLFSPLILAHLNTDQIKVGEGGVSLGDSELLEGPLYHIYSPDPVERA